MVFRNITELEVADLKARRNRLQCENEECFIKLRASNQTTLYKKFNYHCGNCGFKTDNLKKFKEHLKKCKNERNK